MRRVFNRQEEIIRRWINQSQDSARAGNYRIFFEGDYIYSGSKHCQTKEVSKTLIGQRINQNVFLVARYRSSENKTKINAINYELDKAHKRCYRIQSFTNMDDNLIDYKRLIKKRKNSILRSSAHLDWRLEQFKKLVREYNSFLKEFNMKERKINENSMDKKVGVRKVFLKLKGKL